MTDPRRIMVVEDEEGLAITMSMMLKRLRYIALDGNAYGEQAVERAGELKPDLVLMDINLAGRMDGIEAARLIRERYDLPVVFLSALDEDSILRDAQNSTPYGYLIKPVKEKDLRNAIETALNIHGMETQLRESEARYRVMFEQMPDAFALHEIIYDENGCPADYRFLAVNPAYERLTDLKADHLVGRTVLEAVPQIDSSFFIETMGAVASSGTPQQFERYVPELKRHFSFTAFSPKPGQCALIFEDQTQRKAAEADLRESYVRLEQNLRRTTILRNIDQAILTLGDLDTMVQTVLGHILDPLEVDAAAIYVPESFGTRMTKGHTDLLMARGPLRNVGMGGFSLGTLTSQMYDWMTDLAVRVFYDTKPIYTVDLRTDKQPGAKELFNETGFSGCVALPLVGHDLSRGVLLVFRYHINRSDLGWQNFILTLATQVAIAIDNMEILDGLRRSNDGLANAYDGTLRALALAMEERGKEAPDHSDRVTDLSTRLAQSLGITGNDLRDFLRGVILHDFGKIVIPDRILHKTGPLSEEEWVTMRQHPEKAYMLLSGIKFLEPALKVVRHHHEHWDGTGYPHGLKGDEIPLWARIFAVVDVFDALTTPRTYRLAWPREEALTYIEREAGVHFDPKIAKTFLQVMKQELTA